MPDLTEALALYDTATQLDRLRFQLCALPTAPALPTLPAISAHVRTLAQITAEISEHVSRSLSDGLRTQSDWQAVEALSTTLDPLGEALTELGRLQSHAVFAHFTARRTNASKIGDGHERAIETITSCRDTAAEILDAAAGELHLAAAESTTAATGPTPGTGPLLTAAHARSPQTPAPAPTSAPSPTAPTPAATGRAKGR
jgi:hypothetical protein